MLITGLTCHERFKYFEEYIYPDKLWLIDEYAKEKATRDGIDENIIVVSGNPYYDYCKKLDTFYIQKRIY